MVSLGALDMFRDVSRRRHLWVTQIQLIFFRLHTAHRYHMFLMPNHMYFYHHITLMPCLCGITRAHRRFYFIFQRTPVREEVSGECSFFCVRCYVPLSIPDAINFYLSLNWTNDTKKCLAKACQNLFSCLNRARIVTKVPRRKVENAPLRKKGKKTCQKKRLQPWRRTTIACVANVWICFLVVYTRLLSTSCLGWLESRALSKRKRRDATKKEIVLFSSHVWFSNFRDN